MRKGAIRFLVAKVPTLFEASAAIPAVGSKDLEDLLVKCIKQALTDVDAEEFILFIRMLTALPSMGTLTGRQDLVNIILSQSEIDKQFDVIKNYFGASFSNNSLRLKRNKNEEK